MCENKEYQDDNRQEEARASEDNTVEVSVSEEQSAEPEGSPDVLAASDDSEKVAELEKQLDEMKDKLLRQAADFANFRKHAIATQADLILNGGKKVLESLLPILDDMERAEVNMEKTDDVETLKEGLQLVFSKFIKTLERHGLKKMDTAGVEFDTDFHEAVALFPTEEDEKKNHVIDCVQTGYMLNDKVLRHAKVVVGQ